jgi:hypothetical protein
VLDADERIPPELAAEMRQLVATHPEHAGYYLPRRNYVMGHWVRHGGHYPDAQLRLVRAGARFPARHVHERIRVHGTTGRLHHPMDHETYPTLDDLMRKARFYALYEGDVLAEKEAMVTAWTVLRKGLGRGLARTLRRYLLKGGFRDGVPGLTVAFFGLFNRLVRWIRLWELRHGRRAKGADSSGGDEPRL